MQVILGAVLHSFIVVVILGFAICCLLGGSGSFDNWRTRLKQRPRRTLRKKIMNRRSIA